VHRGPAEFSQALNDVGELTMTDIIGGSVDPNAGNEERLQSLSAITDTALNRLAVGELMAEILGRVRIILDADTVTLLRLDDDGENLVAEAAFGLEEEVRQGVTVPVGTGFAGRIAAQRRSAAIDRVTPDTVANPILWEKGLRTMLGAPMFRDEHLIGVLHVGRMDDRPFTDSDLQLLLVAAERVAGAVTAAQLTAESAAAQLLERSLLPGRFPKIPGMELAGRYAAADRMIGGDWYDAFTLPDGRLWLVIGDVSGHGLASAVVMGRVRSSLRAYALLGEGPVRVLELTDRKVHHFDMGAMITVLCAVSAPPYETFEVSSAGHPAPVLARASGGAVVVDIDTNMPLGSIPGTVRTSVTVDVNLGDVLALYTDGLVERSGASIDLGIERLRVAVEAQHPEIVCRTVMMAMVADSTPHDDIALLVARRTAM
jgi:hypothetical protein